MDGRRRLAAQPLYSVGHLFRLHDAALGVAAGELGTRRLGASAQPFANDSFLEVRL